MTIKQETKQLQKFDKQFKNIYLSLDEWNVKAFQIDDLMEQVLDFSHQLKDADNRSVPHLFYQTANDWDLYGINHEHLEYAQIHSMLKATADKLQHPSKAMPVITSWDEARQK